MSDMPIIDDDVEAQPGSVDQPFDKFGRPLRQNPHEIISVMRATQRQQILQEQRRIVVNAGRPLEARSGAGQRARAQCRIAARTVELLGDCHHGTGVMRRNGGRQPSSAGPDHQDIYFQIPTVHRRSRASNWPLFS